MKKCLSFLSLVLLCSCAMQADHVIDPKSECNWTTGHCFVMELEENATTGYSWSKPTFDDAVVKLEKDEFIPPTHGLCGAPGRHVFVFRGIGPGTANIRTAYCRPWEKNVKPIFVIAPKIQLIGPKTDGFGGLVRIDEDMRYEFKFPKADVNRN